MKRILYAFFLILILANFSFSQKNFSLYNLYGTPQATTVNPSFMPKNKIYISLPLGMTTIGVSNSGFSFNDLFTKRSDDSLIVNTESVVAGLAKRNIFAVENSIELLGLGVKVKGTYFNLAVNTKLQTNFIYPKDLLKFALEGNGKNYIGKRASLDGLGYNLNAFTEIAFGATHQINDKLSIGGRLKFLSGIANVTTRESKLGIYTDPETFAITIDGSAEINSSNISQFYTDTVSSGNAQLKNLVPNAYNFENFGIGMDLGASFKMNEKVTLSASIIDLGTIRWKSNTTSYKTNQFSYTFDGIDLKQYFNSDSSSGNGFENLRDSIEKAFNYEESSAPYSTSLYTKFYIAGNYWFNNSINVGAIVLSEFIKGRYNPGISLSASALVNNWLSATINYSIFNKTYTNIGVGVSIKGGPVQFFILSDNILGFANVLNTKSLHLTAGLSMSITKREKSKRIGETQIQTP